MEVVEPERGAEMVRTAVIPAVVRALQHHLDDPRVLSCGCNALGSLGYYYPDCIPEMSRGGVCCGVCQIRA